MMNNFDDFYRGISPMPTSTTISTVPVSTEITTIPVSTSTSAVPKEDQSFLRGYHSPHVASVASWAFRQHDDAIWSHNHRRNHALYAMASSPTPGLPFEQRVIVG